ncbi:unnamed protein product, partial [Ectocarpus fasciculatus]
QQPTYLTTRSLFVKSRQHLNFPSKRTPTTQFADSLTSTPPTIHFLWDLYASLFCRRRGIAQKSTNDVVRVTFFDFTSNIFFERGKNMETIVGPPTTHQENSNFTATTHNMDERT